MFAADTFGVLNLPILHRAEALVTFDVNLPAVMSTGLYEVELMFYIS